MKTKIIFVILISTLLVNTVIYSQVKNCDISYFDSNHVRKNLKKVTFEKVIIDSLVITDLGNVQKIYLKDIIKVGYMSESKPASGMLIGAAIGGGVILVLGILASTSSGGHPDISLNFGEIVGATLIAGLIGGIIGGAIGGANVKREYKTVDLTKLSLNESYEVINNLLESYGEKKK
ncbi:MAG: hypothetical protein WAT71_09755 [Ignavibacteria bacterium]